ncbi:MAG: alpha,alpha-trehalase TreF [Sphingobacteriaceae bacterium]|nr:MAG: alpha,alpha-trehalase TreF [Sphingobacteriaceae bacterium]
MKKLILFLSLFFLLNPGFAQLSPRQQYPGLFEAVQLSGVYADNKTFADAIPKENPAAIMQDYRAQKAKPNFSLKAFVAAHFTEPASGSSNFKSDINASIREHINTLWQVLYRRHDTVSKSSLLLLPHDFIVPGGRFRETYYWDTYFTMLGLQESHKTQLIRNMIDNFAYLLNRYGHIPNGTRTYYLSRSQPPFFSMMLDILAKDEGDQVYTRYQPALLKEYAYFMQGANRLSAGKAYKSAVKLPDGTVLNRYWDDSDQPREESYKEDVESGKLTKQDLSIYYRNIRAAAASGWDFSSRWFDASQKLSSIQTTAIIPVDLNCLLYHLENTIARSYSLQGNKIRQNFYLLKAAQRKKAILKFCWNEQAGWFLDYNFQKKKQSPVETLAGVFPLEFQIATQNQAVLVAKKLKNTFLKSGGLVTTNNRTGQQWDAPNAWAPLQYIAINGLTKYHQNDLAKLIVERWIETNIRVFKATGKLMEKYNVLDTQLKAGGGEYPLQDGFGWTNGVLLNLMNRYQGK